MKDEIIAYEINRLNHRKHLAQDKEDTVLDDESKKKMEDIKEKVDVDTLPEDLQEAFIR